MTRLSPLRNTLLLLSLVSAVRAQHAAPEVVEGPAPLADGVAVGDESAPKWLSCRVVDAVTGAPLPAAEVLLIREAETPIAAELKPAMRFEADEDGFVRGRIDDGAEGYAPWSWICVRAPGYGQYMEMNWLDHAVVRLSPAVPVPVQVRDWADRPVAGALVGFCAGCGHTPDLVHGRTGADGVLTMTGVDLWSGIADFYVVHRDLALGYESPEWFPGARPMVLRIGAGVPHEGVVVDHEGRPVAGAAVGVSTVHRGPWTRTAADGTFQLFGLAERADLWVHHDGCRVLFAEDGVQGMRLVLPPLPVQSEDGVEVMELSDDRRAARDRRREQAAALQAQREQAWPKVPVRVVGLPERGSVVLRTERNSWELDEAIALGAPVALPDAEFVFVMAAEGCVRFVAGDRRRAVEDGVVRLRWYGPTMVEGRVLNQQGAPVDVEVAVTRPGSLEPERASDWRPCRGALSLPTTASGPRWLVVRQRETGVRKILTVDLPERGDDASCEVGTITLPEAPAHRFERPDGSALVDGSVCLVRAGWTSADGWWFEPDEDGDVWLPELLPGDALLVRSELSAADLLDGAEVVQLPSQFVVGSAAPATFRMHGGELRFEVDAGGADAFATIGDRNVALDGPTVVRGLRPGSRRVLIGAFGRASARVQVEVSDRARRRVAVELPAR